MKLSDTLWGLLTVTFGMIVAAYSNTFPSMPGQPLGPSLFPMAIGVGLIVFGAMLVVIGIRTPASCMFAFDDWVRRPRMVLNFLLVVGSLLFYSLVVDHLGFFMTATAFLVALFLALGVARAWIAPVALAVTIVIHYGFYSLLRVPLPWGVLEAIAW